MKPFLLYAIAASAVLAHARPVRVISETPGWFVRDRQALRGDRLSAKEEITGRTKTDLILDCGAAGWIAYTCTQAPCSVRACVPAAGEAFVQRVDPDARNGAGAPASLGSMLASFLRRAPKSPETLGVRGGGNPNDAVVARNGDEVDFAPALNRVLEGRYCFQIFPLPAAAPAPAASFTLDWDRERKESGRARIAGIRPGAYTLRKGTPAGQDRCVVEDDVAPAWVVIAPQSDWARFDAQWKSYGAWFRQLETSGAAPGVAATVRRAVLSSLADTVEAR